MLNPNPSSTTRRCEVREYDNEEFKEHLREDHHLTSRTEIDNMALESKIGYSHQWSNAYYQVNFWCGFCVRVIQVAHDAPRPVVVGKVAEDNDPSDHRWDHIGNHFDKDKLEIKNWKYWECPEKIGSLKEAKFVRDSYGDGKINPQKEERMNKRKLQAQVEASKLKTGEKRKATYSLPHRHRKAHKLILPENWHCVSSLCCHDNHHLRFHPNSKSCCSEANVRIVRVRQRPHLGHQSRILPRSMRRPRTL